MSTTSRDFRCTPFAALCVAAFLAGCATPSDDPREGGLIGYWKHGEQGYQKRLEERRARLEESEAAAVLAREESARLEARWEATLGEVARQEQQAAELAEEIATLQAVCEGIQTETQLQAKSRSELEDQLAALQEEIQSIRDMPPSEDDMDALRERQRRLSELNRELNLLRERASLLTTL